MLHVGGARTALFNWAWARRHGGAFILRVEDTDKERSTEESERSILEAMEWLGMDWDEGPGIGGPHAPYHQSQRVDRHLELCAQLLEEEKAYRCFCAPERITALREEQMANKQNPRYDGRCRELSAADSAAKMAAGESFAVRFRVPEGETRFTDHVRGDVSFQNIEVDDWVMLRSDGSPTYNFVVVCDDADMKITHVLRGEEHLVNTPKQVLLYEALGLDVPEFGHLPLMLGADKKKLSKRTGHTSVQIYRDLGYPRDAVINFLCLQGWALDGETEVFSVDELIKNFEVRDVSKGGAIFDAEKFQWLAGEYLRKESPAECALHCAPHVIEAGLMSAEELAARSGWFEQVVAGMQERIRLYSELPEKISFLFEGDGVVTYDEKALKNAKKHEVRSEVLLAVLDRVIPMLEEGAAASALSEAAKAMLAEKGWKFPALGQPLRCALTGQAGGPDLFDVLVWLGPESARARIESAIKRFE
jgi:nondiscriminating glutamyl-tRNA synthetase